MPESTLILLVDDDSLLRRVLGRALVRLGFTVEECPDGVEAFRILEERRGRTLVLLDYAMPKFNGAQVCEIIRSHANPEIAQTPIILLTAHTGEMHEIECLRAGADDFVSKPVNLPVLKARIETHLRMALLRSQLQAQKTQLEGWRAEHERDLEAARLIQQAIIPQRHPELPGWECASRYQSLIQVGGDVYDWIPLPNNELLVWIADATGHGVSAALLTAFTKLLFRHAVAEAQGPARIIECVSRDFHAIFKGSSFLTAACVLIRPADGAVLAAGAGHPPVLVIRKGGAVEALLSTAPPLGLFAEGRVEELPALLTPGDSLLLFTDGVMGITDPTGCHFSLKSFLKSLQGRKAESAEALIQSALDQALAFGEGQPFDDDVALVAIRRM